MARTSHWVHDRQVQVITSVPRPSTRERLAVARTALAASLLVTVGCLLAWVVMSTPLISSLTPGVRPSPAELMLWLFGWTFAIVVPAGMVILGAARGLSAIDRRAILRSRLRGPRLAPVLGDDHVVAISLCLPEGRRIPELVLGPFGVVVLAALPSTSVLRQIPGGWEQRDPLGRWVPGESPLDRTARDAQRVRAWISSEERDVIVRVHAALVVERRPATGSPGGGGATSEVAAAGALERTPSCAVLTRGELKAWLAAHPPQRSFTLEHRERLAERLRELATGGRGSGNRR
jgi:hypothetical protein